MLFNMKPGVGKRGSIITENSFSFTGNYLFARDEESGHWELALTSGGTLTWLALPNEVDLCICGAGKDGGDSFFSGADTKWYDDSFINSGAGGDGGQIANTFGVLLANSCTVVIGASDEASSLTSGDDFYSSADGPAGKSGGTSATMRQATNSAGTVNKGGADGVWPFGTSDDEQMIPELQGHRIGASGGAGHANNNNVSQRRSNGIPIPGEYYSNPVYTDMHGGVNTGGQTDGGTGGSRNSRNGSAATGYGNGGGGAYGDGTTATTYTGGAGSGGIIFIRDHREVS